MKHFLVLFLIVCLANTNSIAQDFVLSKNCEEAYHQFLALKIVDGKKWLAKEIHENPKNVLPFILINYEDFITLTFNENPADYKIKKEILDKRLEVLKYANQNSPYYLFSKALLYFQWSVIKIKYADYWDAVWNFRKAFFLFKENQTKFPTFAYNQPFIGLQESIISTIPKGYKWASNILGLKGNMKNGMALLKNFNAQPNNLLLKEESQFYYIYLKNYLENDPKGANLLIKKYELDTKNNHLFTFMASNLSINNKNAQAAENYILQMNKQGNYMPFPMLDYELANAKLKRLDFAAISFYQKFLNETKGHFYIKDAYYNMALAYYLQNNTKQANECLQLTKLKGKAETDADKQALKMAQKGYFPNKNLLKARLLNDGGFQTQSLKILVEMDSTTLTKEAEKLEYIYRFARVYDDLEQDDKALIYYNKTIEQGIESTEYFAARAALQAGNIYEQKGLKQKAIEYYQKVIDMDDHDFKNSLDQRAKAGINRLK